MINEEDRALVKNEPLWQELLELAKEYDVKVLGRERDHYGILLEGYTLPNEKFQIAPIYEAEAPAGKTNMLLRIHANHPHVMPDMFWLRPFVMLPAGGWPNEAHIFQKHFGKDWQRFSWHFRNKTWRPFQQTLANTFLPFIDSRFAKVV